MRKNVLILLMTSFVFVLTNCSDEFNPFNNDLELLAENSEIAIINSNICVQDTTHFVRVQRGFHAEDFTDYAYNIDSLYYNTDDVEVNVYVLRVHYIEGNEIGRADTLRKYECRDTVLTIDSVGSIGVSNPILYYFNEPNLRGYGFDNIYLGLEVIKGNKKYYAHTRMVDAIAYELASNGNTFPIENTTFDLSVDVPANATRYIVKMRCRYLEVILEENNLDSIVHTFEYLIADVTKRTPPAYVESVSFTHNVQSFYSGLERHILSYNDIDNAYFRRLMDVSFSSVVFNKDLLVANNGIQNNMHGFNNTPRYFSNIKNGVGYFSAYGLNETRIYYYTSETIKQFVDYVGNRYAFRR